MSWSLNEIEVLAKKAARGAGLSWGLAEDAGKATRWLCAAGLPGAEALAGLLTRNDGLSYDTICPVIEDEQWRARSGTLCPLIAGATLCDRAETLKQGNAMTLTAVSYPVLLVPFVVAAADQTQTALAIEWNDARITRGPDGTQIDAAPQAMMCAEAQNVRIGQASSWDAPRTQRTYRGTIPAPVADVLKHLAQRTYAPETPESRMAGAGAGLTDND